MSEAPAVDGCRLCSRSAQQLAGLARAWWECSHVDCPQRKRVTAAPPEDGTESMGRDGSGCWRIKPVFGDD